VTDEDDPANAAAVLTGCSFCGKPKDSVRGLVAAGSKPEIAICNECVDLCAEIFSEQDPR
jgi:ATP-dependent protease Clp ATPase subunit